MKPDIGAQWAVVMAWGVAKVTAVQQPPAGLSSRGRQAGYAPGCNTPWGADRCWEPMCTRPPGKANVTGPDGQGRGSLKSQDF